MKIEKVMIMQTLKLAEIYRKGTILSGDEIKPDIISEIRAGSPAVSVLSPAPAKPEPQTSNPGAGHPGRLEAENQILREQVKFLTAQVEELQEKLDVFTTADEILGPPSSTSDEEEDSGEKEFPCKVKGCDYVGATEAALRGHMIKHRRDSK